MTAAWVSTHLDLSLNIWFKPSDKPASFGFSWRNPVSGMVAERRLKCEQSGRFEDFDSDLFWQKMLEAMPQGVMVLSRTLELVHCNEKAAELCEQLRELEEASSSLPIALLELCERFLQEQETIREYLVMEYRGATGETVRSRVRWMTMRSEAPSLLLVLLEDCRDALQEERFLEQRRYDLTDREAEVWSLFRQHCTYQEISDALNISMNTVKTHMKNVYAKRRNLAGRRKIWYAR